MSGHAHGQVIVVYDWSYAGADVFVNCPACRVLRVLDRSALDRDGCVYIDCCGGNTVGLWESGQMAPLPAVAVP